jgi:Acetoacetate decarboxylase (ADC)
MWLSLFAVRDSGRADRPPGVYGAAFVDYVDGSVLTYHELLVARLVRDGRVPRVRITDIWVDSPASMAGGRSLWAIPKRLADLPMRSVAGGLAVRSTFSGTTQGVPLATATFRVLPAAALVRAPYALTASKVREDGSVVVTPMTGSARPVPCRASWTFDAAGPLAFLHGRRPFASMRLRDVRLRFG